MATVKKIYEWSFYLIENTVTPDPTDKIAKVKSKKTKTVDDIADRIVQERTEFRKETIVNILTMANKVKLEFWAQGDRVNDGLVFAEPTITGNFYDDVSFDDSRHRCILNARVTNDVHAMLAQVKGRHNGLTVENGGASIDSIADGATGALNGEITPGKIITVTGKKIRVVPEDGETLQSCITYTNLDTLQVVTQEDAPVINDPSKIVLQLPMLPQGFYSLTVKTLFSAASTALKEPRYITSKIRLEVK
jgi:hypothetical protein